MINRIELGRRAFRGAIEVRKRANLPKDEPICSYDLAQQLGITTIFVSAPSFGGMYSKTKNAILIPSLRPIGRQAFTCAHELGHWYFKHGDKIDDLQSVDCRHEKSDEEFLANLFASYLLMPPQAVRKQFKIRGCRPEQCDYSDMYRISSQLGVGYQTLLNQLYYTLEMITQDKHSELSSYTPQLIREQIIPNANTSHLTWVDENWQTVAVDIQIGDYLCLPNTSQVNNDKLIDVERNEYGLIMTGQKRGICQITSGNNLNCFVRISPKNFAGLGIYRHTEEVDE